MSPIKVETLLEDGSIKSANFRSMLLTKCQHEFEKDKENPEMIIEAETVCLDSYRYQGQLIDLLLLELIDKKLTWVA